MPKIDITYNSLLKAVLEDGFIYDDPKRRKKDTKRIQIPKYTFEHNFEDGLLILTTKKVSFNSAVGEFVSFINGYTDLKNIYDSGVNFWFKDGYNHYLRSLEDHELIGCYSLEGFTKAIKDGSFNFDLGPIYSAQMRNWNGELDQIANLISDLKKEPLGTKKTVTMWNPSDSKKQALSCCHWAFEVLTFPIENGGIGFELLWHQHSVDVFLGMPYDILYYTFMAKFIEAHTGFKAVKLSAYLTNVHIYSNHLEQAKEQLSRCPYEHKQSSLEFSYKPFEKCVLKEHIQIKNYSSHPRIKADMIPYDSPV